MSHIIEQGPIYSGGLAIDGSSAQILLTHRQQFSPPEEWKQAEVSNGNGYSDVLNPPGLHSTKQKVIKEVIERALKDDHEVSVHANGNADRYRSVEGNFRLVGPFVIGSAKVVKQENGITDSYDHTYRKYSIGRLGLKGVLGMSSTPVWERVQKQLQR